MKVFDALVAQVKGLALPVALIYVPMLLILLAAAVQTFTPSSFLVRDPSQLAKFPFYIGALSYLGVLIWCVGAAIGLFCAALVRERGMRGLLAGAGVLSLLLGLDDLFTFHEVIAPEYLLIQERYVMGTYALLLLGLLLWQVRTILARTDFLLLGIALAFFGASTIIDSGAGDQGLNYLLDDGLKLCGALGWAAYIIRTGARAARGQTLPLPVGTDDMARAAARDLVTMPGQGEGR
jgi:hypothetical protein